ncbi:hypothetical protein [Anaerococcus sp. AGMB09787]|uniref:hypothetical protein n=1 Tax=Anaerococcus sp. AGMB09787 TaxID=2922869 RepID=UPI001FAEF367|nr:hypothetical protein [Anaerococcus sp. AGMB09787]
MEAKAKKSKLLNILLIISVGAVLYFLIAFVLLPNISVLKSSFVVDGSLSFSSINKIIKSKRVMDGLKNSFLMALTLPVTVSIVGIM